MASGWNLWVWLECIGVVSGCCCREVRKYIRTYGYPHNNYFSLLHLYYSSFLAAAYPYFCSLFKCFFVLVRIRKNAKWRFFYFARRVKLCT